ncbi:MAG TPA: SirB2 family protein [Bacteroidia bacterium]|nr:SirB2 family protein [Bacteroidia bacterium]
MDSELLAKIHMVSVLLFLINYLIKIVLLFTSQASLEKYSKIVKIPDMIISVLFLGSGIWLFFMIGGIKMFHIIKLAFIFLSIPLAVVGFKKQKKGIALLSFVLIVGAYGMAEMSKNKPFIPAKVIVSGDTTSEFAQGAILYQSNCAFCHGQDGSKMYRGAIDLRLSSLDETMIAMIVREGSKGKMPAYNKTLSDAEIAQISAYVSTLRNPENN